MALQDLLDVSSKRKKIGLSEERIEAIKPALGENTQICLLIFFKLVLMVRYLKTV